MNFQHVSDLWLDNRQEMHFSVGQFNEEYLSKAPIGVMRNENNEVIAFCSLMPTYFNDAISVDLIRWLPGVRFTVNGWIILAHVTLE